MFNTSLPGYSQREVYSVLPARDLYSQIDQIRDDEPYTCDFNAVIWLLMQTLGVNAGV